MRPRKTINQMNVVPYIDVMLVLLVIFMVTAPLITPSEIPVASVGPKPTTPPVDALTVRVTRTGTLSVRGHQAGGREQTVTRDQLIELVTADPKRPVVIEGAANATYDTVVRVLADIRSAGVEHAGLLVRPATP